MKPVLGACDVGRRVTLHFGYPSGSRPSVVGTLRTVRWSRDESGLPRISFEMEMPGQEIAHYDLRESSIVRITVGGHERFVI